MLCGKSGKQASGIAQTTSVYACFKHISLRIAPFLAVCCSMPDVCYLKRQLCVASHCGTATAASSSRPQAWGARPIYASACWCQ
eukprot:1107530-Amphidinium_carterae.1